MASFGAQDRWIIAATECEPIGGTFLDIGCGDPVAGNNTIKLEQRGWRGWLVDVNAAFLQINKALRWASFVCADAATFNWSSIALPAVIDYLSFDVDGRLVEAFANLPLESARFRYLTIEHDFYCYGAAPRDLMRSRLAGLGYELLCPDVMCQGLVYEDWWVDPARVGAEVRDRFRTTAPTECSEIVER